MHVMTLIKLQVWKNILYRRITYFYRSKPSLSLNNFLAYFSTSSLRFSDRDVMILEVSFFKNYLDLRLFNDSPSSLSSGMIPNCFYSFLKLAFLTDLTKSIIFGMSEHYLGSNVLWNDFSPPIGSWKDSINLCFSGLLNELSNSSFICLKLSMRLGSSS